MVQPSPGSVATPLSLLDPDSNQQVTCTGLVQGRPDHCDVIVNLAEKNRLHLHTGTYVQGTEGEC